MTAQQFWAEYWTGERLAEWLNLHEPDRTKALQWEFAEALSAHNTAQLTQERDDARQRLADYESADLQIAEIHAKELADHEKEVSQLRAALEAKEKELSKIQPAMRALEGLTPSGSEFAGDVQRCAQFVRDAQESQHRVIVNFSKRAKEAEAELSRLRSQGAGQWVEEVALILARGDYDMDHIGSIEDEAKVIAELIRKHAPVEGAGQWEAGRDAAIAEFIQTRGLSPDTRLPIINRLRALKPPAGLASPPELTGPEKFFDCPKCGYYFQTPGPSDKPNIPDRCPNDKTKLVERASPPEGQKEGK